MSERNCPLCNKPINDEQHFCSECDENAKKRSDLNTLYEQIKSVETEIEAPEEEIVEETVETVVSKKPLNKKRLLVLCSVLFVCIAIGGASAYFYIQHKEDQQRELDVWYSAIEKNTPLSYSSYLLTYPNGEYKQEAEKKIAELRSMESKKWEELKKSPNLENYYSFLNEYPDTPFANEIRHTMDSLSWLVAENENSTESYLTYINNSELGSISGYYKGVAQQRYDYLKQLTELDGEDLEKTKDMLSSFFSLLSNAQFGKLEDLLSSPIVSFYGEKNRSSSVILKAIKLDLEKNKIAKLMYIPQLDSLRIFKDQRGIFFTDVDVTKTIIYKDKKTNATTIEERLRVEMNSDFRIQSLDINKQRANK